MRKFLPLLLVLLLATVAYAQNKGRIVGTVSTADGAIIVGVQVTVASDALIARTMSTTTNERGMFRFALLPVGTFDIKFEKEGYSTIEQTQVALGYEETITLDKVMSPSEFEQVITITGEAPIVDKTSSGISDKLDTTFLQNTPNTRNVWGMPNLSAGFTSNSAFGGVQSAGQAYNTDGVNVSDPATGTVFSSINLEAVEQMDVAMFGAPAEYGAFTGAVLNVVTKSGGNDFHGEVNYFMQRVDWVSDNTKKFEQYGIGAPTASDIKDPNFAVGGPILRDKIWFFFNYNYQKRDVQRELIDTVITVNWVPKRSFIKMSSRWDDRNISYGSWIWYTRDRSHRRYVGGWRSNYENSLWEQVSNSNTYLLQHSYVLSDDLILEGRYAGFRGGFDLVPKGGTGHDNPLMWDIGLGRHLPGSSANRSDLYTRNRDNLLLTANYYNDNMQGTHSMKFGFEYERSLGGRYITLKAYEQYFYGTSYAMYDYGEWEGYTVIKRFAGFAQDSWSISDRLTLNLGFRYDSTGIYADDPSIAIIGSSSAVHYNDPAYRLGFAYDLFGDGRTVLRGFFGRYYEGVVTGNTESLITQRPPTKIYYGQYILGPSAPLWTLWALSGGTGNFFADPDQTNQYTEGLTVGVERELMPNLAASLNFVYKKDHDVIGTIAPDATWGTAQANFSNENGSYSGVYYPSYNAGARVFYTTPHEGDVGVLQEPFRKYWALVFEVNKRMSDRWSMKANYTFSRNTTNIGQGYGVIQGFSSYSNPNGWVNDGGRASLERPHVLKLSGTYLAPFDIYISPVVTWLSGVPYGPNVSLPGGANVLIKKTDGTDRYENQFNVDVRLEKAFVFQQRYRLGIILDIFNVLNDDAVTGFLSTNITSSNYLKPSSIVGARFYQLGFRFLF